MQVTLLFEAIKYLQTLEEKSHVYQIIRASALVEYAKSQPLKFRSSTFWYFQTEAQQLIHSFWHIPIDGFVVCIIFTFLRSSSSNEPFEA